MRTFSYLLTLLAALAITTPLTGCPDDADLDEPINDVVDDDNDENDENDEENDEEAGS